MEIAWKLNIESSRVRDAPARDGEPECLRLAVELPPEEPGLGPGCARLRINPHALHRREIHDDAPVDHRVAGDRVSPAAHRYLEVVLSREAHHGDHVSHARAARDQGRTTVNHAVEHGARRVVAVVPRPQQLSAAVRPELLDDRFL
jgi:hypothetical protein